VRRLAAAFTVRLSPVTPDAKAAVFARRISRRIPVPATVVRHIGDHIKNRFGRTVDFTRETQVSDSHAG